jgi:hypothetical protein
MITDNVIEEEERECYICLVVSPERHMDIIATGAVQLWWCHDAEWCRSRAAANKLEADDLLRYVSLAPGPPPAVLP